MPRLEAELNSLLSSLFFVGFSCIFFLSKFGCSELQTNDRILGLAPAGLVDSSKEYGDGVGLEDKQKNEETHSMEPTHGGSTMEVSIHYVCVCASALEWKKWTAPRMRYGSKYAEDAKYLFLGGTIHWHFFVSTLRNECCQK